MIVPDKYLKTEDSFIFVSALIINVVYNKKLTVDNLWKKFQKKYKEFQVPYNKFLLVLGFMYISQMIDYNESGEIFSENLKTSD